MVKEAEIHAADDKRKKEEVEARNTADTLCYTAEKSLRDAGDKVTAELKTEIEGKVKALREVLQTASVDDLKSKTQDLSLSLQKIGQAMYGQQGGTDGGQGPQPQDGNNNGSSGNAGPQGQNNSGNTNGPVEGEIVS